MSDFQYALFSIVFGMSMILFRKFIVRSTSWGSRFFQFNIFRLRAKPSTKKEEDMVEIAHRAQEVFFIIIGSLFVVLGLLELFGVIHFRQ